MPNYNIKVQDFEGPLDLLIHLIEKDKIDIYDIPIVAITGQYVDILRNMAEYDMEVASEFLLMAATLLQIKSRMLLPKPPLEEGEAEADPRQMLVEMLIAYRKIKLQVQLLLDCRQQASLYHTRPPMQFPDLKRKLQALDITTLLDTLVTLVSLREPETALIERQEFHVQDKMQYIIQLLQANSHALEFTQAMKLVSSRSEKVATFLAVLELMRRGRVTITQSEPFSPIYIFLREDEQNVL
ncbi:MAG: segregation/condensation protein A [Acidaminococcaceae bacterium]